MKYDVFICHASEDKPYVEDLVQGLRAAGVSVWYDRSLLEWGDDLRSSIDEGLIKSRFGLIVFSPAFLKRKRWTEYELSSLFSREDSRSKVILPIWHNVSRDDLMRYSPGFADRLAMLTSNDSVASIVSSLLRLLAKTDGPPETPKLQSRNSASSPPISLGLAQRLFLVCASMERGLFWREHASICFAAGLIELDRIEAVRLSNDGVWSLTQKVVSDAFLDRTQRSLASYKKQNANGSISLVYYFGSGQLEDAHRRLIDQLLVAGMLDERKARILGIFPKVEYIVTGLSTRARIIEEIRREAASGHEVSEMTRALISLAPNLHELIGDKSKPVEYALLSKNIVECIQRQPSRYDAAVSYVLSQELPPGENTAS
jgi:hypothetical protein